MCKISVVIPVYNVEKYLSECLESVVAQTFTDIEILCIDDASTDKSIDILREYKKRDGRLQVIELSKNKGLSAVRNIGIEKSKGKYIYFLDSDDLIEKEAMEVLYKEAEENQLEAIFFDAKIKYDNENLAYKFRNYKVKREGNYFGIKAGMDLFERFVTNQEWSPSAPRQFWKRSFILENNLKYYEGIIHEDELFTFEALMRANRVKYVPETLFIRRFRENSIMTKTISDKSFLGLFTTLYYMNKWTVLHKLESKAVQKHLAIFYGKVVRLYSQLKNNYNLAGRFFDVEVENAYHFFEMVQNQYMAYGNFDDDVIEKIKRYKYVYIYGAGIIAKAVYEYLLNYNVVIQGFIVSEAQNNPNVLMAHEVQEISEMQFDIENTIVIIAVNSGYRKEVIKNVIEKKLKYIISDK